MIKPLKDYEELYEITNKGVIYSLNYKGRRIRKKLSVQINSRGYLYIDLTKNKVTKKMRIHRLVAMTFIPNTLNLPCVNHKDGNKTNNSVSNLEWCTASENTLHAYRVLGKCRRKTIKVDQYDLSGKFLRSFNSYKEAAKAIGVHPTCLSKAATGFYKRAGNFAWKPAVSQRRPR